VRKVNLEPYTILIPDTSGKDTPITVDVKDWIANVIFHPDLKLNGREVIQRGKLSEKIEKADKEVILEEVEYQKIKEAFDSVKGFSKMHIELLERVFGAQMIEVEEKKKK